MIFMKRLKTHQDQIDREAADWVVKWEDCEHAPAPKEQSRWFSWLRRSPRHLQSYLDTADLYERLGRMDPDSKIDVDEWIAGRRAPVVSITKPLAGQVLKNRSILAISRGWWWGVAAASLVGIVAITPWSLSTFRSPSYRTAIGQQSVSRLDDGSIINLNTRSRAKVRFSDTERVVELEGEAMFTVAKDPARPFLVRTRGATIRAVGTMFNVYERENETRVAVVEGTVQVISESDRENAATASAPIHANGATRADKRMALSAGEAARVSRGQVAKLQVPDIDAEVAWQKQKLVFEDATLESVAAEFNRYNKGQLRIEGPIGQTKRLSGTFDALHPQSLLLFLRKDTTLTVESAGDDFVVREH